jgi:hypothetical protein
MSARDTSTCGKSNDSNRQCLKSNPTRTATSWADDSVLGGWLRVSFHLSRPYNFSNALTGEPVFATLPDAGTSTWGLFGCHEFFALYLAYPSCAKSSSTVPKQGRSVKPSAALECKDPKGGIQTCVRDEIDNLCTVLRSSRAPRQISKPARRDSCDFGGRRFET